MTFYGYILASAFTFYDAYFGGDRRGLAYSFFYTGLCQMFLAIAIFAVVKKLLWHFDLPQWMENGPLWATLMIAWMIGVSIYYTMDRAEQLTRQLNQKTNRERMMWGIIAIMAFVVPVMILGYLSPIV